MLLSHSVVSNSLYDPMDWSLPGPSVHGISQARILEWIPISFSRGSSQPRDQTHISCLAGRFFPSGATWEAPGEVCIERFMARRWWQWLWGWQHRSGPPMGQVVRKGRNSCAWTEAGVHRQNSLFTREPQPCSARPSTDGTRPT